MLVIVDEPEAIERASTLARARLLETALRADGNGDGDGQESVAPSIVPEDEWRIALGRTQRLSLEQLPLQRDNVEPKTLRIQTVTRYHGQVSAFLAEVRGRVAAGEHVLIAAASTGELERLTDLCREYEVPYSLGELDATVTGARLVEDTTSGSAPSVVLVRAPLPDGFIIPDLRLAVYGTDDLFESLPAPARPRQRPKTAGFFSDFSELKAE